MGDRFLIPEWALLLGSVFLVFGGWVFGKFW
jgi:hypothetical protein